MSRLVSTHLEQHCVSETPRTESREATVPLLEINGDKDYFPVSWLNRHKVRAL